METGDLRSPTQLMETGDLRSPTKLQCFMNTQKGKSEIKYSTTLGGQRKTT
jgi:hypothetical protein